MKLLVKFFAAGLACLALGASLASAQSTAQINGAVRDSSGLAIPGAEVKATQTATGASRTVTSAADGGYVLPNLSIGPYMLEVTKTGFSKYVQSGILLQVDSNPTIDAVMKVGSVNEQITVQADATLVETQGSGVGNVVDSQRVVDLPLNGRNPIELVFLAGMASVGAGAETTIISSVRNYPTVVINVAGGLQNGVAYTLDGTNDNDVMNNLNLPLPFPDALQEFKVETSALPAQYGYHSSGAVSAVTKSGTNEYHGDLFEFLRNGDFNARDFFATSRDTLKRSQFGGTIGGPVLPRFKNKLFFFAGYQAQITKSTPPATIAYVPNAAMMSGNFTTYASPACHGTQLNLPASAGFVNNTIAPSLFNAAALKIQATIPTSTDPCGKYIFGLLSASNEQLGVGKIDYQISSKQSFFGRYTQSYYNTPTTFMPGNALTLSADADHSKVYNLALGHTYILSSTLVNSFRIGATRTTILHEPDNYASWQSLGVNALSYQANNPRIAVTGLFNIGGGSAITDLQYTGPNPSVYDDLSWIKGSHQFGFGAQFIHAHHDVASGINATGVATFSGQTTGNGITDFLLGDASAWAQGSMANYTLRQNYYALYAQDSWKVNRRITVNYGVRYEPYLAPTSKYDHWLQFSQANFNAGVTSQTYVNAPAGLFFPGDPGYTAGNGVGNADYKKFVPRVGLVFDPTGNGKMTIRASYGMFTDRMNLYSYGPISQDSPFGNLINLNGVNLSNPWASQPGGNPFPVATNKYTAFPTTAGAYTEEPLNLKTMYNQQWNLSLQRQLGNDWLVTVNYLGTQTTHLPGADELNPAVYIPGNCVAGQYGLTAAGPCSTLANEQSRRVLTLENPTFGKAYGVLALVDDGGTASYNALFLSARKRLSHGTTVLANYTWSHCISTQWNVFVGNTGTSSTIPGNLQGDRANCTTGDQRQIFNLSAVAETPTFSNKVLRVLASKWQIAPILVLKSAQFFTVTSGIDTALNGEGGQRPNQIGNPYVSNQGPNGWITSTAFVNPAPGVPAGTLGLDNIKGPGVFQLDVSLTRTFRIREKQTLQFRADAFNLPNWVNFSVPASALNVGTFGHITTDISGTNGLVGQSGDPRIIQFALKYVF